MVVFNVFSEGDKARQRRNQRAATADIHAEQQGYVIVRELRKQNCRRYIAYNLTGEN